MSLVSGEHRGRRAKKFPALHSWENYNGCITGAEEYSNASLILEQVLMIQWWGRRGRRRRREGGGGRGRVKYILPPYFL